MLTDARLFEALLRGDFRAFIGKVFTTLCPGQEFVWSWQICRFALKPVEHLRFVAKSPPEQNGLIELPKMRNELYVRPAPDNDRHCREC